ncbi:uncharacterized protein LOC121971341 isoform X2 [Zingiber officinale]|uniref:uncharacterized protein LOC121971341 isoform X2 n=1 Tax=Zingiber officinale TaxID=94328 RepID=UPI001C4B1F02|nr:uncharacterized protein LOC121971341 isoform X2 [Zingiber officinale]
MEEQHTVHTQRRIYGDVVTGGATSRSRTPHGVRNHPLVLLYDSPQGSTQTHPHPHLADLWFGSLSPTPNPNHQPPSPLDLGEWNYLRLPFWDRTTMASVSTSFFISSASMTIQNFAINSLNKCMRQVQGLVCLYLSYDPRLNTLLSLTFPFVVDQSQYSGSITLNARSASGELLDLRRRFSMMQSRS